MPRRSMTIEQALTWAFDTERAQLDFAEEQGDNARPGISTIWTIMERGHLGCSVDGGGRSLPHHEADIIASAVAHLPARLGGKGMAVLVAEHARAGRAPEWRSDPGRVEPVAWKGENQFGRQAQTEVVEVMRYLRRGRAVEVPVLACPIRIIGGRDQAAMARRRYAQWRAALAWLLADLSRPGRLCEVQLSGKLPVDEPWADPGFAKTA